MTRFQYHVFVCENQRPLEDPKGCCASKGGSEVLARLRELVKGAGLNSKIRINSSGCMANCARGVTVVVYPDDVWYSAVRTEDADEILEQHLIRGIPVARLMDPVFHADIHAKGDRT